MVDKIKDLPFYEWKEFSKLNSLNFNAWYTYGCFGLLAVMCFSQNQVFRIIGMLTIMLFVLGYAMLDYYNLKKKFLEANKGDDIGNN
jgi:hypothetical protein